MLLLVNRIYYNSSGQQIRTDTITMKPKMAAFKFGTDEYSSIPVTYKRKVDTQIIDVHSDMTVGEISLIGNFTSRDATNADWCEWELDTGKVSSGTRETKSVRCNMSDLPNVGDSAI